MGGVGGGYVKFIGGFVVKCEAWESKVVGVWGQVQKRSVMCRVLVFLSQQTSRIRRSGILRSLHNLIRNIEKISQICLGKSLCTYECKFMWLMQNHIGGM